jgi:RimJ/RimL family protein N-acetyltransferase
VSTPIALRPATAEDAQLLLDWRNDPEARAASFEGEEIAMEGHRKWLAGRLADPGCALFVVERDGVPAGSVRLEREGTDAAEIHIAIAREARGGGLASATLREASERAGELLGAAVVRARVKPGNEASLRAFGSAGFEREEETDEVVVLARPAGPA